MNNPLVSICLPTYNYAHYLAQAISSCLNQSYEHIEIIIVDDASTDNSCEVISSYDDPRIRFVENPARLGLVENWNKTLSLVRGEIIKFLFADDYLENNAVACMVAALEDPDVNLVFSSAKVIDAQGNHTRTHQAYPQSRRLFGPDEAKRCLKEGNYIGGPTAVAIRASTIEKVGKFNEGLGFHGDQEMWIRVLLSGDAYCFSEPLVSTRQHEGSETSRLERTKQIESETIKFITCCLQNEELRSILSETDVRELLNKCEGLSQLSVNANLQSEERFTMGAKGLLKQLIKNSPLYRPLRYVRDFQIRRKTAKSRRRAEQIEMAKWVDQGKPIPPPHIIKQEVLLRYAHEHGLRVLVETGTCLGEMVEAMKDHFDRIYSIELDEKLFRNAKRRFATQRHITLIHGDSGKVLEELIKEINEPALFWLDGHYSEGFTARGEDDTPIRKELSHILASDSLGHVIIIDDARMFGSDPAYPTLEEIRELVASTDENLITVADDSIRIVLR